MNCFRRTDPGFDCCWRRLERQAPEKNLGRRLLLDSQCFATPGFVSGLAARAWPPALSWAARLIWDWPGKWNATAQKSNPRAQPGLLRAPACAIRPSTNLRPPEDIYLDSWVGRSTLEMTAHACWNWKCWLARCGKSPGAAWDGTGLLWPGPAPGFGPASRAEAAVQIPFCLAPPEHKPPHSRY